MTDTLLEPVTRYFARSLCERRPHSEPLTASTTTESPKETSVSVGQKTVTVAYVTANRPECPLLRKSTSEFWAS